MKFMILTTKYESNPKATACKGFEKFMSVKKYLFVEKYLLPNSAVALVDILRNNKKFISSSR